MKSMEKVRNIDKEIALMKRKNGRLIAITCINDKKWYELLYHFDIKNEVVTISVRRKKPFFKSIIEAFPSAEIYEREAHEMYGVKFDNPTAQKELFLSKEEE